MCLFHLGFLIRLFYMCGKSETSNDKQAKHKGSDIFGPSSSLRLFQQCSLRLFMMGYLTLGQGFNVFP